MNGRSGMNQHKFRKIIDIFTIIIAAILSGMLAYGLIVDGRKSILEAPFYLIFTGILFILAYKKRDDI